MNSQLPGDHRFFRLMLIWCARDWDTFFYFSGSTIWPQLIKCLSRPNPETLLVQARDGKSKSPTLDLLVCPGSNPATKL